MRSYVTVHDAGRLLNPMLAEGQIRGGLAHGLGAALLEEHRYDEDGNLMTGTFLDYLPPTATELPRVVSAHFESPSPLTPLGREGPRRGHDDERARRRSRTPSPTRSASTRWSCRRRRSASGSCL